MAAGWLPQLYMTLRDTLKSPLAASLCGGGIVVFLFQVAGSLGGQLADIDVQLGKARENTVCLSELREPIAQLDKNTEALETRLERIQQTDDNIDQRLSGAKSRMRDYERLMPDIAVPSSAKQ
jgi:hypothetical protein